jgi:hypothetical protein
VDPLPSVKGPVAIGRDPVTESHPDIGESGPVEIVRYLFFVEQGEFKFRVDLPPGVTSLEVPGATIAPGKVKFEIIARTATGNNTAIEGCFLVKPW